MPDVNTVIKKWNSVDEAWEDIHPETTVGQIVAGGTADSTTFLRGDGQWATVGDITGVTAGTGLSGGGSTGAVTLNLDADLSDLNDVSATAPTTGEVLKWNGSQWAPGTDGTIGKEELQQLYIYGKASTAITKGDVVQFAGAQGDHILMKPAVQSEINSNPNYVIGIAEATLSQNDFGYVIVNGRLTLDTTGYSAGDILYFDSEGSTAGALTTTEPTEPNAIIELAAVSIGGNGNGEFVIRTTTLTRKIDEINGLQDALDAKVDLAGDTMTGTLKITDALSAGSPLLDLHNSTNGVGAGIRFTDVAAGTSQFGNIVYRHQDSVSYGSNASFEISSDQPTTTILANGKLMYGEGIYSKPATGTGAGTRKDENWDTAYGWGNHADGGYVSKSGDTTTGSMRFQNDLNYFGLASGTNEAEIVINTGNTGNPQIGFTEHNDASWAVGVDDNDNGFKIHGASSTTIPTIGGLSTPHFEIDTTGNIYVQKRVYLTGNSYIEYNSVNDSIDFFFT